MKTGITYILLFLSCFFIRAQQGGYQIIDDQVVFTFDIRDYENATHGRTGKRLDFKDLDIHRVSLSGEFNNWSAQGWKMVQKNKYIYELRKSLTQFSDKLSWEFKFVVNNTYWAEPDERFTNTVNASKNGILLDVYNLKMFTAIIDLNGNACFRLDGYQNASQVILTGDFNRWDRDAFIMNKVAGGWELVLKLKPGTYEYKFIVDDLWIDDPKNPNKVYNEYHTFNSVCTLTKEIPFRLDGFTRAKRVFLAGDFNDWNKTSTPMIKKNSVWELSLELTGGKHHYKFIVDGYWITDPNNPVREYDGKGNINSVIMVE